MITLSFAVLAAICFALAVIFPFTTMNAGRLNLVALGLLFIALAIMPAWGTVKW